MPDHDLSALVELIAQQTRETHPDWRPAQVYCEVMAAICGQGDFAEIYTAMRGRVPSGTPEQVELLPVGAIPPTAAPGGLSHRPEQADPLAA
jgi:hypothetical protein